MNAENEAWLKLADDAYAEVLKQLDFRTREQVETLVDSAMKRTEFLFYKMKGQEELAQVIAMGIACKANRIVMTIDDAE